MKKIYSVMILCVAVVTSMLFVSCERDIIPTETVLSVIDEEVTPSYTSCKVTCSFYTDATIEYASVQYSTTEDFAIYDVTKMKKDDVGSYEVELTKLQDNTTYYFRYEVNACLFTSSEPNKVSKFQTLLSSTPEVTTIVKDISHTSATINGKILFDGGSVVTECGIVYSLSQNPTIENTKIKSNNYDSTGAFACKLTNLQNNSTYYARAYAKNVKGITYGETVVFVTLAYSVPMLTTSITNISPNSATIDGQITSDGGLSIMEYGIVYGTSKNPTIANTTIESNSCNSEGLFTSDLTNLQKQTTYYARAYAINAKGIGYSEEISFTADYQYVDLGLSVKWATCNVGATKPEEPGDYFAWGETLPKDYYDWSNYKWCNGGYRSLTKYCDDDYYAYSSSYVDKIYVLQLSDDAARANWGGKWRMPLKSEFDELYTSCTWKSTTQNGTAGYLVTGKNGKSIFLPKAGDKYQGSLEDLGSYGYYWSSTVCPDASSTYPYCAYAYSNGNEIYKVSRCYGLPVRPVCP